MQCSTASSAVSFKFIVFPPLYPPSAVINILAPASIMRSARAFAEKPAKTTEWIAPILAQASIEIASSGTIGRYIATLSPFLMPLSLSTLANLFTSS